MKKITPFSAAFMSTNLSLTEEKIRISPFALHGRRTQKCLMIEGECEVGAYAFARVKKMETLSLGRLSRLGTHAFAHAKIKTIRYDSIEDDSTFHKNAFAGMDKANLYALDGLLYFAAELGKREILVRSLIKSGEAHTLHMDTKIIHHGAFRRDKRLQSLTVNEGLRAVGRGVFHPRLNYNEYENALYFGNAENPYAILVRAKGRDITECTVHESTRVIAEDAFFGCKRLEKLCIRSHSVRMHKDTFKDCSCIADYEGSAEILCHIKKQKLVSAVITAGERLPTGMIRRAPMLTSLAVHCAPTEIEEYAICDCPQLSRFVIPISVERVGYGAISECPTLVIVCEAKEAGDGWYSSFAHGVHSVVWDGQGSMSVQYYYDIKENTAIVHGIDASFGEQELLIPANRHGFFVRSIGFGAFFGNETVKTVTVESAGVRLEAEAFAGARSLSELRVKGVIDSIGVRAFAGCDSLTSISADGIGKIDAYAFAHCKALSAPIFTNQCKQIPEGAFSGCESIRTLHIPEGVCSIGAYAFCGCTALSELTLPSTLETIHRDAFRDCKALRTLVIPKGVKFIDEGAFRGCTSLKTIEGTITRIAADTFRDCTSLERIGFLRSTEQIGARAFKGCTSLISLALDGAPTVLAEECFSDCTSLASVQIPSQIRVLARGIFKGCSSLRHFHLEKKHTKIPEAMFEGCGLSTLTLPPHVDTIGRGAFAECHELTELILPNTVLVIEPYAFHKCGNLTRVRLNDTIEKVEEYAFAMCGGLVHLQLGASVREIGENAFAWCGKLSDIVFGSSLERISEGAFAYGNALLYLTLPDGLKRVGAKAFFHCRNMKTLFVPKSVLFMGKEAFIGCDKLSASCEIEAQPSEWNADWIGEKCDIAYGVKR